MKVVLPDPKEVAAKEAAQINANREAWLDYPLQRVLIDAPYVQREKLLEGIEPFHRERMQRLPPAAKYPEAGPWVEHILAIDRELQRLTAMQKAMSGPSISWPNSRTYFSRCARW